MASSPTLFPPEYVLEYQKCLDATESLPWSVIKEVIEKELGECMTSLSMYIAAVRVFFCLSVTL